MLNVSKSSVASSLTTSADLYWQFCNTVTKVRNVKQKNNYIFCSMYQIKLLRFGFITWIHKKWKHILKLKIEKFNVTFETKLKTFDYCNIYFFFKTKIELLLYTNLCTQRNELIKTTKRCFVEYIFDVLSKIFSWSKITVLLRVEKNIVNI